MYENMGTRCKLVTDLSPSRYIGAVPTTGQNLEYIARQRETFERGVTPPDYPQAPPEISYIGIGRPEHIIGNAGLHALGFPIQASA